MTNVTLVIVVLELITQKNIRTTSCVYQPGLVGCVIKKPTMTNVLFNVMVLELTTQKNEDNNLHSLCWSYML